MKSTPPDRSRGSADAPARRDLFLAARVIPNKLVRTHPASGGLRLTAPVEPTRWTRIFGGGGAGREKTFELDRLGAWVWERLAEVPTVEHLIQDFAREQRVNLREAEVAVVAFLKLLTRRGLIALAAPGADDGTS
jgi:hypothetical protein